MMFPVTYNVEGTMPWGKRTRTVSLELAAEWIERFKSGKTVPEIAREYGQPHHRIRQAIARAGLSPRTSGIEAASGSKSKLTEAQWAEAAEMYKTKILPEIGRYFGLAPNTILKGLLKRGVQLRGSITSPGPIRGSKAPDRQYSKHPGWEGGRHIDEKGYVRVIMPREHPFFAEMALVNGYVLEHRLVIATLLGRPLRKGENIHHINGDKQDNRPENLQLMSKAQPSGVAARCADCGSQHIVFEQIEADSS